MVAKFINDLTSNFEYGFYSLIQDLVYLLPSIVGTFPIDAWRINIINTKGQVVRTFEDQQQKVDNTDTSFP